VPLYVLQRPCCCTQPAQQLLDAAVDAFIRQTTDPRPWWQQSTCLDDL
jgi:hypothetical protein